MSTALKTALNGRPLLLCTDKSDVDSFGNDNNGDDLNIDDNNNNNDNNNNDDNNNNNNNDDVTFALDERTKAALHTTCEAVAVLCRRHNSDNDSNAAQHSSTSAAHCDWRAVLLAAGWRDGGPLVVAAVRSRTAPPLCWLMLRDGDPPLQDSDE